MKNSFNLLVPVTITKYLLAQSTDFCAQANNLQNIAFSHAHKSLLSIALGDCL